MSVAFSPDSRYLVTGSWDNTARIWDTKTYTTVGAPLEHPGYVYSVAFSPDGAYLATGARDGKIRLWALEDFPSQDPKLIATREGHTDLLWNIAFSPDGRYLASSSWDGTIRRYPVRFEDVLDLSWKYAEEEK
jgi:WD40 repeat protein